MRMRAFTSALLGGGALVIGAGAAAFGPGAGALVDWLADGRAVGSLGALRLDGVSGAHLGSLRFAEISLSDAGGVYAIARNAHVDWRPLNLLWGEAHIALVSAETVEIVRAPALVAPASAQQGPTLLLDKLTIQTLRVTAPELGSSGGFAVQALNVAVAEDTPQRFTLAAQSLAPDADALTASLKDGAFTALWRSAPAGLIGSTLQAMGPVEVRAEGAVRVAGWGGGLTATIAGKDVVRVDATGEGTSLQVQGEGQLASIPALAPLVGRIGASARFNARLSEGQAVAALETARIKGEASVPWAPAGPQWPAQARLSVDSMSVLAPGFTAGPGRLAGMVKPGPGGGFTFDGEAAADGVRLGGAVLKAMGPFSLSTSPDGQASVIAQAQITAVSGDPRGLWRGAHLSAQGLFGRQAKPIIRVSLKSDAGIADLRGDGATLAGQWRVENLARLHPGAPIGVASGDIALAGGDLRLTGQAIGLRSQGPDGAMLAQLLGRRARFSAQGRLAGDGLDLRLARLDGAKLRLGVRGRVGARLDLRFEAAMRGPLVIGGTEISGLAEADGRVFGSMAAARVQGQVRAPGAQTPLGSLTGLTATVDVDAKGAQLQFAAQAPRGPVSGEATLRFTPAGFEARAIRAAANGLVFAGAGGLDAAGGRLAGEFAGDAASLDPALSGALAGLVDITPDRISFEATLKDGRIGVFEMDLLSVRAIGPPGDMAVEAALIGAAYGETVSLTAQAKAQATPAGIALAAMVEGRAGGADVRTSEPIAFGAESGRLRLAGALAWGEGEVSLNMAAEPNQTWRAEGQARDLDLSPVLALIGEPGGGRLNGTMAIVRTPSGALVGGAQGAARGLTLSARAPDPLDLDFEAKLIGAYGKLTVEAKSESGLNAFVQAEAPLRASDVAFAVRLDPAGVARATWRASGEAEPLWSAFGPLDQRLAGKLEGAGLVEISPAGLSGAGAFALQDATFEDAATGLALIAVNVQGRFDGDGLTITSLTAKDRTGGALIGTAVVTQPGAVIVDVTLDRLLALNREDLRAVASGPLKLNIQDNAALLTGRLTLDEVQARPPRLGPARALLAVREINRASPVADAAEPIQFAGAGVDLDIALFAPSRVFARGRGLQSEWALDVRVRGELGAPILTGQARLLRGDVNLAGRAFDVTSGEVRFAGALAEARLDLTAERSTTDISAQIRITGPLNRPEIAFLSTPVLPAEEILPRVLFGRAGADLSPLEAAQLAASLADLSGQPGFDLAGAARDFIRLDRLDVREVGEGVVLAGGKYLTPEVYLELARSSLGASEVALEWRIRPQFFLISRFDAAGDARLSLRWREED
jgi:translocation and assembly module TamB